MKTLWAWKRSALGLAAALALGACGGGDGGGGTSTSLDPAQAAVVGEVAATQVSGMASGLTNFNYSGGSLGGGFFAPATPGGRLIGALVKGAPSLRHRAAFQAFVQRQDDCSPTVDDETDSDQDGVPDNALYTFACSFTDSITGDDFSVTGTIGVQDVHDVANGFGFNITFTNFTFASSFTDQQNNTTEFETEVDGSYGTDITTAAVGATQDVAWAFRLNGRRVFFSSWDWNVGFTPDAGTVDWVAADFPAGTFDINGDFIFSGDAGQDSGDWAFSLNTTNALVYDGSCALEPPFASGTIEGAIIARTSVGFTINYTGCGSAETIAAFDNNS